MGNLNKNEISSSKKTLSITLSNNLYEKLQTEIGKGQISQFIEQTVNEKLSEQEKTLERAYQEISQDKKRWKLTKDWEKVALSDLRQKSK